MSSCVLRHYIGCGEVLGREQGSELTTTIHVDSIPSSLQKSPSTTPKAAHARPSADMTQTVGTRAAGAKLRDKDRSSEKVRPEETSACWPSSTQHDPRSSRGQRGQTRLSGTQAGDLKSLPPPDCSSFLHTWDAQQHSPFPDSAVSWCPPAAPAVSEGDLETKDCDLGSAFKEHTGT